MALSSVSCCADRKGSSPKWAMGEDVQNTVFVDPAAPGNLQDTIFVNPAAPANLQDTIFADPAAPANL